MTTNGIFDPTEKQLAAIANMEKYLGIRSHRSAFSSKEAFQDYWDKLSKRCDGKTQHRQTLSPEERLRREQSRQQRQQQRKQRYYTHYENLHAYALAYCKRYQPSTNKLKQQLAHKCVDTALVESVFDDCHALLDDRSRAQQLVTIGRKQGKSIDAIKAGLKRKLFAHSTIAEVLEEVEDQPLWSTEILQKKIQRHLRARRSKRDIRQRLISECRDQELVDEAMESYFDTDSDKENLQQLIQTMSGQGVPREKLIRKLLGKGFSYHAIQDALNRSHAAD